MKTSSNAAEMIFQERTELQDFNPIQIIEIDSINENIIEMCPEIIEIPKTNITEITAAIKNRIFKGTPIEIKILQKEEIIEYIDGIMEMVKIYDIKNIAQLIKFESQGADRLKEGINKKIKEGIICSI